VLIWGAAVGRNVVNVGFVYPLSVCSRTKENHGTSIWRWPVAGHYGCFLSSSQQSGI
jgi:hypothetical protein